MVWRLAVQSAMLTTILPVLASAAMATAAQPQPAPQRMTLLDAIEQAGELPPPQRLGVRSHLLREAQVVRDTVVVVPDAVTAAEAIAAWNFLDRFPVLIDDGSDAAAENIGRFVRAFGPVRVVTWSPDRGVTPGPVDADQIAAWLHDAIDTPADARGDMAGLVRWLMGQGVTPHGVVATSPRDDAWIAGLAIAAARLCPIIEIEAPGRIDGAMTDPEASALSADIATRIAALDLRYDQLGDDVDAVLLAMNSAGRIAGDGNESFAITDRVTRVTSAAPRWAWAGQLFGDPQTALYRAMCGLFLTTDSAWLFDGYPDEGGWQAFDTSRAQAVLQEASYRVVNHDTPANTVTNWLAAASSPVDAGLVLVNSKGGVHNFQVVGGPLSPGDVPIFSRPAAFAMVHSFSAQRPANRTTVAGRWLERGVYAYYGSVHEPLLNAFVPTPIVAARLVSGFAFGAAVRLDEGPAWKLNLLGDPMVTFVPGSTAGRRIEERVPLAETHDLAELAEAELRDGAHAAGLRTLILIGRDDAAVRLANGIIGGTIEAGDQLDLGGLARLAVLAAFRENDAASVLALADHLSAADLRGGPAGDAVWAAHRAARSTMPADARTADAVLKTSLRIGQEIDDGIELAEWMHRDGRRAQARMMLESLAAKATTPRDQRRLERAINARP